MAQAEVETYSELNAPTGKSGGLNGESWNDGSGKLLNGKCRTYQAASDLEIGPKRHTLGNEANAQGGSRKCSPTVAKAVGATRIDAGRQAAVDGKVVERATDDSTGIALCR